MINIVFTGNGKMFDGVFLCLISILRRTQESINVRILTADFTIIKDKFYPFSKSQGQYLDKFVKTYNPENSVEIINVQEYYNEYLFHNPNEYSHYSPYCLLRLLLDVVPDIPDKVIYIDSDIMACGDIKELYDIDMTNIEYGATLDYLGRTWINKSYINTGVLLLNIKYIKETGLFRKACEIVKVKKMEFPDQTPLNTLYKNRIYLPGEFRFNEQRLPKENTVLKHFCRGIKWVPFFHVYNIKQWEINKVQKILKIHTFDEDFKIFLEKKETLDNEIAERHEIENQKYIIQITNLRKTYGNLRAVDGISFNVKRGALFAFLGVNGAGKSTTINIVASILNKDSGRIVIDGYDLEKHSNKIKGEIGIVFQNSVLDSVLTVDENLRSRAAFYNLTKEETEKNLNEIVELLDLKPLLDRPVKLLSGGQKRRVDIARSMVHMPKILILDEPSTGLDPKTRTDVWHLIDKIRKETNMTVFLTTHYLEEADQATDVVIIDHGEIIAQGTPTELKNQYAKDYVIVYCNRSPEFDTKFSTHKFKYSEDSHSYFVYVKDSEDAAEFLYDNKGVIKDFEVKKGKMDDVFLNVTGMVNARDEEE